MKNKIKPFIDEDVKLWIEENYFCDEFIIKIIHHLRELKYHPSFYTRGKKFRFHIDMATNAWGEGKTFGSAFRNAYRSWKKLGFPKPVNL